MSDWIPLRDYLRADMARQLDHYILHDDDRHARAWLAANREAVLKRLCDQAELITLRRMMQHAQTELHEQHHDAVNGKLVRINGHAGHRVRQ